MTNKNALFLGQIRGHTKLISIEFNIFYKNILIRILYGPFSLLRSTFFFVVVVSFLFSDYSTYFFLRHEAHTIILIAVLL
jgi:hypothetical protein